MSGEAAKVGKIVATNRRAWHDYEIEDTFEAGIVLAGSEVKSLRLGRASLDESFARIEGGELVLCELHINEYQNSPFRLSPTRERKLLVHRHELERLIGQVSRKGMTIIPLKLYFSARGWAKVQLGVAKGRLRADRREAIKKREAEREIRRAHGR